MKRTITLILITIGLAACGGGDEGTSINWNATSRISTTGPVAFTAAEIDVLHSAGEAEGQIEQATAEAIGTAFVFDDFDTICSMVATITEVTRNSPAPSLTFVSDGGPSDMMAYIFGTAVRFGSVEKFLSECSSEYSAYRVVSAEALS